MATEKTLNIKPSFVTKLERIKQLETEIKALKDEVKPILDSLPVGVLTVGSRAVKITTITRSSTRWAALAANYLSDSQIAEAQPLFTSTSVYKKYSLLGKVKKNEK